jgi:hypothetical protein
MKCNILPVMVSIVKAEYDHSTKTKIKWTTEHNDAVITLQGKRTSGVIIKLKTWEITHMHG